MEALVKAYQMIKSIQKRNKMDMKMVILMRKDLSLPKGKAAAQAAHAAVEAALRSDSDKVKEWRDEGQKKIILRVVDERELIRKMQEAKDDGLQTALITDAGKTCIAPGTKTCCAIGPDSENKIDRVTGDLPMY